VGLVGVQHQPCVPGRSGRCLAIPGEVFAVAALRVGEPDWALQR
jgi:hypothetical protein